MKSGRNRPLGEEKNLKTRVASSRAARTVHLLINLQTMNTLCLVIIPVIEDRGYCRQDEVLIMISTIGPIEG